MRSLLRILVIVIVVVIVGGIVALATLDLPAPTQHIERVIANDRLGH